MQHRNEAFGRGLKVDTAVERENTPRAAHESSTCSATRRKELNQFKDLIVSIRQHTSAYGGAGGVRAQRRIRLSTDERVIC